jgi:SAM-dependent methyltransferase
MELNKIDHNELMTAAIEWDVFNWSNALVHWSGIVKSLNKDAKILCLGERNGGLSLWFALQGFKVTCSDFGGPTDAARELHTKYGVSDFIEYADINIFELPYPAESFDVVACKSVIGGLKLDYKNKQTRTLENQKLAIDEVRRILKTGGFFLGAENMKGSRLHQLLRKVLKGKNIGWRHFEVKELRWLLRDFTTTNIVFFGFVGSYFPFTWFNRIFSSLDSILSKLLPNGLLYISFITAKK